MTYTVMVYVPGLPLRRRSKYAEGWGVLVDRIPVRATSPSKALDKAREMLVKRVPHIGPSLTLTVDPWWAKAVAAFRKKSPVAKKKNSIVKGDRKKPKGAGK